LGSNRAIRLCRTGLQVNWALGGTMNSPTELEDCQNKTDPSLLQLIGIAADLLGIGETVQRIVPTDRIRVQRRHRRINRLRLELREHIDEARSSLVIVRTVLARRLKDRQPGDFSVFVPAEDRPLYEKGLDWLHISIRDLTRTAYRLEAASEPMPGEVERYYRISDRGQGLLEAVRTALDGLPESTEKLLAGIDQYLIRCSEILDLGDAEQDL